MADAGVARTAEPAPAPRHRGRSILKWVAIGLGGILLLFAALLIGINSDLGRRYVTQQINNLETASGLDIDVDRIEGSIFGKLTLNGLRLKDPKGLFFYAPEAKVDWRPLSYFKNHIDIQAIDIPRARLFRKPELRPGDPNAPLLPDIDIDIGRFSLGRLLIEPPVTGQRHLLSLGGKIKIADGRAQVATDVGALVAPGIAGGDRLSLRLDAVPQANRFGVGARIDAPAGGFVAGLTGLKQPLRAQLGGRGSWNDWRGRAAATLGGQPFANLAIGARDGQITVDGPLRPGLVLPEGALKRLAGPQVQLNLVTALANRRADTRLKLSSRALSLAADGLFDFSRNRFEDVKVAARLIQPGAAVPNLKARDLRVALVLNGAFAAPIAAYDIRAASVSMSGTTVEGLTARGRARIDTDRTIIPVSARARRILGAGDAVGNLLTNVALDGTFAVSGSRLISDDLRVRSDKVNVTAIVAADLARGQYRAGIKGRINNYQVDGIGLLDITTDMNVVTAPGGFALKGRIAARTKRIDNESARNFLGGNATVAADVTMNPAGVIRAERIRLSSPQLRITSGTATYWPDGRVNFRGAAISKAYGALGVVVTGTVARPQVQLRLASPGFGIGLRDVSAQIRATADGYAITATGQSQYGPFTAEVLVRPGRTLTLDIRRLVFAGITFRGRVVRTPAGPFVGTLSMNGQGLDGAVRLAAAGRYQRADVVAQANGATIPGPNPILIQRGAIQASVILYPDAPHIVGEAQLAGVRANNLLLRQARARIDYRAGRGTAQLVADGQTAVPFQVAINSQITPDFIRAAARGTVNRIPFRLTRPAELRKVAGVWQLSPTQIVLPQGNVLLAGRFGNGVEIQSRLQNLDLSIVNVFAPGVNISGRATGSLDFAQPTGSAFPRADVRLNIENFTRTGIAVRSTPVNMALLGTLRPEGGALAAVIRRGGALIGRAQVRLQPVGPTGASWTQRLLAAPLQGGVRYNGPADVLWSLAGVANQQLAGPIGVAADFSGRVQAPQLNGVIRANNLTFVDETYGTRITNIALAGRFTSSRLEIERLTGRAGEGTVTGSGSVGFAAASGYPIDVRLNLQNAQLARSDNLGGTVTGDVAITNSRAGGALIKGQLQLAEARYQIIRQGAAQVVELQGVRRRGQPLPPPGGTQTDDAAPSIWKLDLRLAADNRIFVSGMGLESEWEADLHVQGTTRTPSIVGEAELIRGTYSFSGRRFEVERGRIAFTGARPPNPRVDLVASADIEGVRVSIDVSGTATAPQIAFSSSPGLPQDEILSRILFGGSINEISALQAVQLASSLNALRGGGGGLNPLGKLRSATGLDRLRILGADDTSGRGTAIAAGFYVSNDIYLELITDARGFTATQLEIALSRSLSVLSQVGSQGSTNVNLRYRKDY
jgi:translocation and assembly module TamB